jgi:hypothetical protein
LLDWWRRELTSSPLVFPVIRCSAVFSIGAAVLRHVPAVAPLDRDGNEPAAINIGEGSTARPAVTNRGIAFENLSSSRASRKTPQHTG